MAALILSGQTAAAVAVLVAFIAGNMWYLDAIDEIANASRSTGAKTNDNVEMGRLEQSGQSERNDTIEGAVETYQDNTWNEENLDIGVTEIPGGIDVQGMLTDLPGFTM